MYTKIMVPVDLAHVERLEKALASAADLARHYGAAVCYVGVTTETPGEVAHTPEEFAGKLQQFGAAEAERHGLEATTRAVVSLDPAVDLNRVLIRTIGEVGADLVVMPSHVPGLPDHLFGTHAGHVAAHAGVSVFVIR